MFVRWLSDLNFFETNATDAHSVRLQRWSTRLYILFFSFAILILGIYGSFKVIIRRVEIQHPTIDVYEQLEGKYSTECACSGISIPYGEFVQLKPSYHQICSSKLVTQQWIDFLFDRTTTPFYYVQDFRATASQQFQLLAILCQLSAQAIDNGLRSFTSTAFISGQLLSKIRLSAQMQADIDAFKRNTPNAFFYTLVFIHRLITGNALLPAVETVLSFFFTEYQGAEGPFWISQSVRNGFIDLNGMYCDCAFSTKCYTRTGFFGDALFDSSEFKYAYLDVVEGWYVSCYPINSLFNSTLKSFYNQTMLDSVLHYFANSSVYFPSLDIYETTIFDPNNTTLETIVNAGFIEKWTQNISYSLYFDQCAPKSCIYTIKERFNIFYIITTLLGLYGGLTMVLRFITPTIITFIFRRKQPAPTLESPPNWLQRLRRFCYEFNLFKSATHVEPSDINRQRWSTRFYIIILTLVLIILTVYTTVKIQPIQIDLIDPSFNTVLHLQQQQDSVSSLQCPCSQLSVSFKYFVELTPTYHEVCSSDFVSEYWIYGLTPMEYFFFNDFRKSGSIFRLLQSYCQLATQTVDNALHLFYETQLIEANLMTPDLFASEMASRVHYFQLVTPDRFSNILEVIRETTQVNQFISMSESNYQMYVENDTGRLRADLLLFECPWDILGVCCSSILNRECRYESFIRMWDQYGNPTYHLIPGFYVSYYYSESLLLSQLQCLYNQSCIDTITILSGFADFANFTALSQPSHFSINATFASLINNLFIESLTPTINYAAYFEQCQSHSCSYTVNRRPTVISVITTIVGLFGGLSVLLRFVSPLVVTLIFTYFCRQIQEEEPLQATQRQGRKDS